MKVGVLLTLLYAFDLCDSSKKPLYLLDLYTCVEEFEEYCHQIPRLTIQAAAEAANNCTDLLPEYTIYTSALNIARSIASGKVAAVYVYSYSYIAIIICLF